MSALTDLIAGFRSSLDTATAREQMLRGQADEIAGVCAETRALIADLEEINSRYFPIDPIEPSPTTATAPSGPSVVNASFSSDKTPAEIAAAIARHHGKKKAAEHLKKARTPPPATTGAKQRVDYAEIAAKVNELRAAGTWSYQALQDHFGVPRTTVTNWLTVCRNRGLISGRDTPDPKPKPVKPQLVLRCSTCGFEVEPDKAGRLATHTRLNHGREVFKDERTPIDRSEPFP